MKFYFESKEGKMKHMQFYYSVKKASGDTSSSRWWKEGEIKHNHLYFAKRMRRGKTEVVALLLCKESKSKHKCSFFVLMTKGNISTYYICTSIKEQGWECTLSLIR